MPSTLQPLAVRSWQVKLAQQSQADYANHFSQLYICLANTLQGNGAPG